MNKPFYVLVVLLLASYCYVLKQEMIVYETALAAANGGFVELMTKKVHGKILADYLDPHSVGTFKIGEKSVACGMLSSPLPSRPLK